MKYMAPVLFSAIVGLLAGVCTPELLARASGAAETACMMAVNDNYGGNVENLDIISSEFSQANSEVILNADGERWRCLVSDDGEVQELTVQEDESGASSGVSSAAETACMMAVNNNYGGNVENLEIVSEEFSEANSEVVINADGERWYCLVSDDGEVQDLRVK